MELEDYAHPLIVTGCGIYRLIRQPIMHTIRAEGRKDYQLLYISSGKAFFEFPEGTVEVSAGEMILYRPGVPQRYWYLVEDRPEVCWIHFTGSQAESYLNEAGFSKNISSMWGFPLNTGNCSDRLSENCSFVAPASKNFLPLSSSAFCRNPPKPEGRYP
ncbi:MAG: AraC family ligand binding domain-containing protein [Blautia sp.]